MNHLSPLQRMNVFCARNALQVYYSHCCSWSYAKPMTIKCMAVVYIPKNDKHLSGCSCFRCLGPAWDTTDWNKFYAEYPHVICDICLQKSGAHLCGDGECQSSWQRDFQKDEDKYYFCNSLSIKYRKLAEVVPTRKPPSM